MFYYENSLRSRIRKLTTYILLIVLIIIVFNDQFNKLEWILFGILILIMIISFGLLYYRISNLRDESIELPRTLNINDLLYLRLSLTDRDFNSNDYNDLLTLDRSNNSNGLTNDQLQLLPSYTLNNSATSTKEENICTICLDPMINGETIRTTPCQHSYHLDCIDKWLLRKAICPVCNYKINNNDNEIYN